MIHDSSCGTKDHLTTIGTDVSHSWVLLSIPHLYSRIMGIIYPPYPTTLFWGKFTIAFEVLKYYPEKKKKKKSNKEIIVRKVRKLKKLQMSCK